MKSLRTKLEPPALEAEYREEGLVWDKRVASGLILVTLAFLVITIPVLSALEGNPGRFRLVGAIRVLELAIAGAALFLVRRVGRPQTFDAITTAWIGLWFVGIIAENALLPAAMTDFVWWDVFLTVTVYAAAPLPFPNQVVLAALLFCGDFLVLWKLKTPGPYFSLLDVTMAFASANVVGAFVSLERHGWRRRAFLGFRREHAARTELQAALREVKTLQGIIPICSHCKNIRTQGGDWQQIEAYVRSHSNAEFSHGMCPDCLRRHYPDFAEV